ncbi:hypothetical protein HV146_20360 [Escherichia coli]|nr:hypothetical protein [Escherichia coli]QLX46260.1 hypothetical protein HV146_20360 [Escherichia coli]
MATLERVDSEYAGKIKDIILERRRLAAKAAEEYISFYEQGKLKPTVEGLSEILTSQELDPEIKTLLKSVEALITSGYMELAKELAEVTERLYQTLAFSTICMDYIIDGAIKKHRSDSASGPRHHLHDEIVAIMKATWKKEPAFSQTKMIAKLSRRYEGRISEETIKYWIKNEKLAPPPPPGRKYKNTELVIPPEYA